MHIEFKDTVQKSIPKIIKSLSRKKFVKYIKTTHVHRMSWNSPFLK